MKKYVLMGLIGHSIIILSINRYFLLHIYFCYYYVQFTRSQFTLLYFTKECDFFSFFFFNFFFDYLDHSPNICYCKRLHIYFWYYHKMFYFLGRERVGRLFLSRFSRSFSLSFLCQKYNLLRSLLS